MQRIAIITAGAISNVMLLADDMPLATDGSQMLEAEARAANIPYATRAEPVISVTMTRLKLALIDANLYDAVVAALAAIEDATERAKALVWFGNAVAESNHPLVAQLAADLNLTDEQVSDVFTAALQSS